MIDFRSMHIVIDSNIFYQDRNLSSPYFARLRELGRLELLTVHIPWVVYRECTTKSTFEIQTDLDRAIKSLDSAAQKGLDGPESSRIRDIAYLIQELRPKIQGSNSAVWWSFINESKAQLHDFNDHHAREVFAGYFDGDSPYKIAKNREDIPDAFIFQMVLELAANKKIYFLSGDKNLSGALAHLENVIVVESFRHFFEESDVKQLVERSQRQIIESEVFRSFIISQQESFENAYVNYVRRNKHITMIDQMIPSDYHEAEISELYHEEVNVLTGQIKFIERL